MKFLSKWYDFTTEMFLDPENFFTKTIEKESHVHSIKFSIANFAISGLLTGLLFFLIAGLKPTSLAASLLLGFHLFIGPTAVATFFLAPIVAFVLFVTGLASSITGISSIGTIVLISAVIGAVAPVVGGAIAHGAMKVFGGKGTYEDTIKVFGYTSATSLLSWIPVVNFFASLYSVYLGIVGMYHVHEIEKKKDVVVIIALLCLAYVLSAAVGMYVLAEVR